MSRQSTNIADRSDVFYWQTDRAVEPAEAGRIWADRHRYFSDEEIVQRANDILDEKLVSIEPLDAEAQTNLGNVNSVRIGILASGVEIIIRCHPKGIRNGYFHVESEAARRALASGVPSFKTLAVHEYESGDDFAFQVLEKLPGTVVKKWIQLHPTDEQALLPVMGATMAQLHRIHTIGFGPFDNAQAKNGELVGLHKTLGSAIRAGLTFNLKVLVEMDTLTTNQATGISQLFSDDNSLLSATGSILVHNDFADWNLLTDGAHITGVLDWDECVAGDPVADIACWSTFFEPERLQPFLTGYWSEAEKPVDFDEKFELFRLRYIVSKMTLRLRRYSWEKTDFMRGKIETGKIHLAQSLTHFGLQ